MGKCKGSAGAGEEFDAVGYVGAAAGEGKFTDCDWLCGIDAGGVEPGLEFVEVERGERFGEAGDES